MLQYKIGCLCAVVYDPDKFLRKAEISILVLIKCADTFIILHPEVLLTRGCKEGIGSARKFSRLQITRTFKGNRKKVRVIGSSKKIAESKVKNSFYYTGNI